MANSIQASNSPSNLPIPEAPGYVERSVQYLADRIISLAKGMFCCRGDANRETEDPLSVEQLLLKQLKAKELSPEQVREEFLQRVPSILQKQMFEEIGKKLRSP